MPHIPSLDSEQNYTESSSLDWRKVMSLRKYTAEFLGTFFLVFLAVGAAIFGISKLVGVGGTGPGSGVLGVAFAFGLVVFVLAYAFGPISGTNINHAVTLGLLLAGRLSIKDAVGYWVAQFLGATAGAGLLATFVGSFGVTDYTGGLGTNSYDNGAISMTGAFVLEMVLTAVFVLVILLATEKAATPTMAGAAIGFTLVLVHIVGIPLTGTSVNPARSFGPALFAGGEALGQVWLFIVAPMIGAVIAWAVWKFIRVDAVKN
jgi:aquaporin Z